MHHSRGHSERREGRGPAGRLAAVAVVLGLALIAAGGCYQPAPATAKAKAAAMPPPPPGSGASLANAGATFGNQQIPMPATTAQLLAVLGEPDRTLKLVNDILVWDQRGVYAYRRKDRDEIHDISFAFQKQGFDFDPQTLYSGTLDIAGTPVSAATPAADLKQAGFVQDGTTFEKSLGTNVVLVEHDGRLLGVSFSVP